MSRDAVEQCPATAKIRYASRQHARLALVGVKHRRTSSITEQSQYHCAHCGGWHLTKFDSHAAPPVRTPAYQRVRFRLDMAVLDDSEE